MVLLYGGRFTHRIPLYNRTISGNWQGYNSDTLTKDYRCAALGITVFIRSTPHAVLNIILYLLPIDKYIMVGAARCAIRLVESAMLRPLLYGHTRVLKKCRFHNMSNSGGMSDHRIYNISTSS